MKTIAAAATPPGTGGIAVIRISGDESLTIVKRLFRSASGRPCRWTPWRVYLGNLTSPEGEIIDEVLATYFKGPRSYTGEDMVEISCHGGPVIVRGILDALFHEGATPAEPGEFTRRAFRNGKIDLSQAEAIAQLTAAESEAERRLAMRVLAGGLSRPLQALRRQITEILAGIELDLDFPEEDAFVPLETTLNGLSSAISRLKSLLATTVFREDLNPRFRVVIAGKVNAGKSLLFNRLTGKDASIVTEEPGTTRDAVSASLPEANTAMTIVDTAGFRETDSAAETESIRRTRRALETADLVLCVIDGSEPDIEIFRDFPALDSHASVFCIWNKIDIAPPPKPEQLELIHSLVKPGATFLVSARTGEGVDLLKHEIVHAAQTMNPLPQVDPLLLNQRQKHALEEALRHLQEAENILSVEEAPECAVPDIRMASQNIGLILGDNLKPDVLNTIFSNFCIGK